MMNVKNFYWVVFIAAAIWSCKSDDDSGPPQPERVPPRLLSEQVNEDDAEIVAFLKSHFYNYEEFQSPADDFDYQIRFDTIAGNNADKISIFDSPNLITETIKVSSESFGRTDGEEIDHVLYVLMARQGASDKTPSIGDNVILRLEGFVLNGNLFESVINQPTKINLSVLGDGGFNTYGLGRGMQYFKTGTDPVENGDGTFSYQGYGIGAIFMPSGLGYFSQPISNLVPPYAPLVFKVDAFSYEPNTDLDGDGIPSILEDVNNNGNLNDDNTDSEDEVRSFIPNYQDADDDNDGIPTIEEINLKEDGSYDSFRFTDDDDIPDHLDIDS
ncbi:FKBP-type peptidyl-prolyl cis-trans isomerase [Maribacter chungangensis]|uniref:peptidylprolyl isomerase n=1 Tax=Maribacter chungangensis TaxID=1069117 RepID=A0ABW3B679_9FLAO